MQNVSLFVAFIFLYQFDWPWYWYFIALAISIASSYGDYYFWQRHVVARR